MALCHATMTGLSTLLTLPITTNQQKPRERSRGCFSLISKKKKMKEMLFVQRFYKGKHPFVKHGQVSNVPDCPKSMATTIYTVGHRDNMDCFSTMRAFWLLMFTFL